MIYLTSDSHLGHCKLSDPKFTPKPRIELFTTEIIIALMRYAKPENSLIHLGDILLSSKDRRRQLYGDFRTATSGYGHRTLIKGNHDKQSDYFYREVLGFDAVVDGEMLVMGKFVLSHEPSSRPFNIHGHCHGKLGAGWRKPGPSFDVSPEAVGYDPVPLELIIASL